MLSATGLRVLTLFCDEMGEFRFSEISKDAQVTLPYTPRPVSLHYPNMLFGGSEVLEGEAYAIAVQIGANAYLGRTSRSLPSVGSFKGYEEDQAIVALKPYLQIWGAIMLLVLLISTAIGLLTMSGRMGLLEIFLPICMLCGASSPAILLLYFRFAKMRAGAECINAIPTQNRAVLQSTRAEEGLANMTDLFVIGSKGCSDGVLHFHSAYVGNETVGGDDSVNSKLQPLCEAFCLLKMATNDTKDSLFQHSSQQFPSLELMQRVSGFDAEAMQVRLKRFFCNSSPYEESISISVEMQDTSYSLLFFEDEKMLAQCLWYEEDSHRGVISPAMRQLQHSFWQSSLQSGALPIAVARKNQDGGIVLLGIASFKEEFQAVLPSVVEELSQCGVRVTFFFDNTEEASYLSVSKLVNKTILYASNNQNLSLEQLRDYRIFVGFSKEKISNLIELLKADKKRVAVFCGNADERCFLRASYLIISCDPTSLRQIASRETASLNYEIEGKEYSTRSAQVMRRHSDILIHRAGRLCGGISAVLQAMSFCRAAKYRMRLLLKILLFTQTVRLIAALASVLMGVGLWNGVQMVIGGFLFDIVSVVWVLSLPIHQASLRGACQFDATIVAKEVGKLKRFSPVVFSVCTTTVLTSILVWCGVLSADTASGCLFFSVLLLQLFGLYTVLLLGGVRLDVWRGVVPIVVVLLPILLLGVIASFLPNLSGVFGIGFQQPISLIIPPILFLFYFLSRFLTSFFGGQPKK